MAVKKHVHTYERIRGQTRYKCADPDCSTIQPRAYLHGKRSKCWACGGEFVLDADALRRARPHCGCVTGNATSNSVDTAAAGMIFEQLFKENQ